MGDHRLDFAARCTDFYNLRLLEVEIFLLLDNLLHIDVIALPVRLHPQGVDGRALCRG